MDSPKMTLQALYEILVFLPEIFIEEKGEELWREISDNFQNLIFSLEEAESKEEFIQTLRKMLEILGISSSAIEEFKTALERIHRKAILNGKIEEVSHQIGHRNHVWSQEQEEYLLEIGLLKQAILTEESQRRVLLYIPDRAKVDHESYITLQLTKEVKKDLHKNLHNEGFIQNLSRGTLQIVFLFGEKDLTFYGDNIRKIEFFPEQEESETVEFRFTPKREGTLECSLFVIQKKEILSKIPINLEVIDPKNEKKENLQKDQENRRNQKKEIPLAAPTPQSRVPDLECLVHSTQQNKKEIEFKYVFYSEKHNLHFLEFSHVFFWEEEIKAFQTKVDQRIQEALVSSMAEEKMKNVGTWLWNQLFPLSLQEKYFEISDQIQSLCITIKEMWIPWEIIAPFNQKEENSEVEFFSMRHQLSRSFLGSPISPILSHVITQNCTVVQSSSSSQGNSPSSQGNSPSFQKNSKTSLEYRFLKRFGRVRELHDCSSYPASIKILFEHLKSNKINLWHVVLPDMEIEEPTLLFEQEKLIPEDFSRFEKTIQGQKPPLICFHYHSQRLGVLSKDASEKWAEVFQKQMGCPFFLTTLWNVDQRSASRFTRKFYSYLSRKNSVAEALEKAKNFLHDSNPNNLAWLAYSFYGNPKLQVFFGKDPNEITNQEVDRQNNQEAEPFEFHSGKRLRTLRKLKRYGQKEMINEKGFPSTSLRNYQVWEEKGISKRRINEVAEYFDIEPWVFIEESLKPDQLKSLFLNFTTHSKLKKQLYSI